MNIAVFKPKPSARVPITASENPGRFLSVRTAYTKSRARLSSERNVHWSRLCSRSSVVLPNRRRAASRSPSRSARKCTRHADAIISLRLRQFAIRVR